MFNCLQINCGGAYVSMCDVGQMICEKANIALIQEPYTVEGMIRGLPLGMKSYLDKKCNAAIIINDPSLDCILLNHLTDDFGVCVLVKTCFGDVLFVSVYCKFNQAIDPYISYMDRVLCFAHNIPCILGIDANASSPLWFSKTNRRTSGGLSHERGNVLSNFVISSNLSVLNVPSVYFTFDGPNGKSDIDVTLANSSADRLNFDWQIMPGWSTSDHNIIAIKISGTNTSDRPMQPLGWITKEVNWENYIDTLKCLFARNLSPTEACLCGYNCESVVHVVCECPLYEDIRDLNVLGVSYDNVIYELCGVLSTVERFTAFEEFAKLLFDRRRRLTSLIQEEDGHQN